MNEFPSGGEDELGKIKVPPTALSQEESDKQLEKEELKGSMQNLMHIRDQRVSQGKRGKK